MSIAFVDEDKSATSKALADKLIDTHANVRFVTTQAEGQTMIAIPQHSSVRRGDLIAYLVLRPDFGESLRTVRPKRHEDRTRHRPEPTGGGGVSPGHHDGSDVVDSRGISSRTQRK